MSATPEPGRDDSPVTCPRCRFDFVPTEPPAVPPVPIGGATEPGEPPTPTPQPAERAGTPQKIGRFEIRRYLGEGSFGRVYEAYDMTLRRAVALKVARPEMTARPEQVERFSREARAAANLMHPNVVAAFDSGSEGGHHFIAYAFVPGRSLDRVLAECRLGRREAVELVRKLAEALAYAHRLGVVHRDVKPANVMLREDGEPMLMDFGLAAWSGEEGLTASGQFMGTPQYCAPEQWVGKATAASDQYALGCLLFELLTGERPFAGANAAHYLTLHTTVPAPSPRKYAKDLPRDLENVTLKCLEKEQGGRYADCGALAEDLRRWLAGDPVTARRPGMGERLVRWSRKNPAVAALAMAVLLVFAIGATVATVFGVRAEWEAGEKGEALAQAEENEKRANDARAEEKKARDEAEAARKQEEQAKAELEKTNAELTGSVARGLLRPLAVQARLDQSIPSPPPLGEPEVESLWELATSGPEVRKRFLEEAVQQRTGSRQLQVRSEYALHAAAGLDAKRRDGIERVLIARLHSERLPEQTRLDLALILARAGVRNPDAARQAADALVAALASSKGPVATQILARALAALSTRLEPGQAGAVADAIALAMAGTADGAALMRLAEDLATVSDRAEPDRAVAAYARGAHVLLTALDKSQTASSRDPLLKGVGVLLRRMGPKDTLRAAESLVTAMSRTVDPEAFRDLAQAFRAAAARLGPDEAARVAESLIAEMTNRRPNGLALQSLAEGFAVVAPRLRSQQAGVTADALVAALAGSKNLYASQRLAEALAEVAPRLAPQDAARACGRAAKSLLSGKTFGDNEQVYRSKGLVAVSPWLNPEDARAVAGARVETLRKVSSADYDPFRTVSRMDSDEVLAEVFPRLGRQDARKFASLVVEVSREEKLEKRLRPDEKPVRLAGSLAAVAPWLEPQEAPAVADVLLSALRRAEDYDAMEWLTVGLLAVVPHLTPDQAARVAISIRPQLTHLQWMPPRDRHLHQLSNDGRPRQRALRRLAEVLLAVVARLGPKDAATVTDSLRAALVTTNDPYAARHLIEVLDAMAERQPNLAAQVDRACDEAAGRFALAAAKAKDSETLHGYAGGLAVLWGRRGSKGDAATCTRVADLLVSDMTKKPYDDGKLYRSKGLVAVSPWLEPAEAAKAAEALTLALTQFTDEEFEARLVEGLAAVAARLGTKVAEAIADRLLMALSRTVDQIKSRTLLAGLTATLSGEDEVTSRERSLALASSIVTPCDPLARLAAVLLTGPPRPPRLAQFLVDLLKHPFCVGAARRVVLGQLSRHYGRPFADQWEFVRYATDNNLALDLHSPPRRPERHSPTTDE